MDRYDVIIVGGGPAGSSCAWKLSQAGLATLVLDAKAFPRVKPCAGWITPQVVETLQLDVDGYRSDRSEREESSTGEANSQRTCQPIRGFRCGVIGGRSVDVRYDHTISYGIRRCEFDTYLLHRCGASLRLAEPVEQLQRDRDGWTVNARYRAPMLVGAGGHRCPVARLLGEETSGASDSSRSSDGAKPDRSAPVVVAREVEFPAPNDCERIDPTMPHLYFCEDLLGYGWCVRKGSYLNIGLGRTDHRSLPHHVEQFVEFLRRRNQLQCELPTWMGHAYRLYEHAAPRLYGDRVLLVGDAAGLAYPVSGEGIRPAVESGILAAAVIQQAADYRSESLAEYHRLLTRRLGMPRQPGIEAMLPGAWMNFLGPRLLTNRSFCRHVLLDKWFLHRGQAALAN